MRLGRQKSIPLRLFPAHTRPLWRRVNAALTLWLTILIVTLLLTATLRRAANVVDAVAERQAVNLATRLIHEAVDEKLTALGYTYTDFVTLQADAAGRVQALTVNPNTVGRLKTEVALEVEKRISSMRSLSVQVPFAAFFNDDFGIGTGLTLTVELAPVGGCTVDFENSFTAVGINQTKHQIDIVIEADFAMLAAFIGSGVKVQTSLPVAQTVIVGTVPESYFEIQQ